MKTPLEHTTAGTQDLLDQLAIVNRKLLASETMKSNFLSNIRNELNNPIASILELSRQVSHPDMSSEQIRKFAKLIHSEMFQLDFQLRNICRSAEIEAGETALSIAGIRIGDMIRQLAALHQHALEKKHLQLILSQHLPENFLFSSDSEKLHQILNNLLANAIQFSTEGDTITITSRVEEDRLQIAVRDQGCGISETVRQHIFDRFRQGQEGPSKNYGGHGLGLSVASALLDLLDGSLQLETEEGKGSCFTINLPPLALDNSEQGVSSDGNDVLFNDSEASLF